jgi:hypothetical protein
MKVIPARFDDGHVTRKTALEFGDLYPFMDDNHFIARLRNDDR